MAKLQFKCGEILPLWERYKRAPRKNLEWFVGEMRAEVEAVEERIASKFENPSVKGPAEACEACLRALKSKWEPETAERAALLSITCVVAAYKTAAGHRIVFLRKVIDAGEYSEDSIQRLQHKKARECYGAAAEEVVFFQHYAGAELIKRVDKCVSGFCKALGAATRGIYPEY